MTQQIPREVSDVLGDYCQAKRSGCVILDIKDGHVLAIRDMKLTLLAKVDKART